jgi:hypothetical protein
MGEARGELVLLIGDDIIPTERLLEAHLLAHARRPEPGAAILGHIDWPPWLAVNPVMAYVCGEGTHQFAYEYIPRLPALDYRFFYTSNISVKRRFLAEALEAGIRFDPCFRYAAYEDSEFACRLQARGLTIHYVRDALAYHDHWMDLESFGRREYHVGQMAVVFYRKHPARDDVLQVRWIDDWTEAVEKLVAQPALAKQVAALDAQTDQALHALARAVEELLTLDGALGGGAPARPGGGAMRAVLHRLLALVFDVERTRGKVQEWYATVQDAEKVEAAKALLAVTKKLAFFGASGRELESLGIPGWDPQLLGTLQARATSVEEELRRHLPERPLAGTGAAAVVPSLLRRMLLGGRLFRALRSADLYLVGRLQQPDPPRWLACYPRVRHRVKRLLF